MHIWLMVILLESTVLVPRILVVNKRNKLMDSVNSSGVNQTVII